MKIKWPLMFRATHEVKVKSIDMEKKKDIAKYQNFYFKKFKKNKKDLHDVVKRLTEIAIISENNSVTGYRWRVMTEVDPMMITGALERGNDDKILEYIAESIAYQIKRELKSCNIQRPDNFNIGKRG